MRIDGKNAKLQPLSHIYSSNNNNNNFFFRRILLCLKILAVYIRFSMLPFKNVYILDDYLQFYFVTRERKKEHIFVFFSSSLRCFVKQTHVGFGVIIEWTMSVYICIYSETDAAIVLHVLKLKPKYKATLIICGMKRMKMAYGIYFWPILTGYSNYYDSQAILTERHTHRERDLHCMPKSIELKCCLCNGLYFHMIALNLESKIPCPVFLTFSIRKPVRRLYDYKSVAWKNFLSS